MPPHSPRQAVEFELREAEAPPLSRVAGDGFFVDGNDPGSFCLGELPWWAAVGEMWDEGRSRWWAVAYLDGLVILPAGVGARSVASSPSGIRPTSLHTIGDCMRGR